MRKIDEDTLRRYSECFTKGYSWYLSQQRDDGSLGTAPTDDITLYNAFYVFAVGGRWNEARRFRDWAYMNIMDNDGTLRVNPDGIVASKAVYFKGWTIWGAHQCGFFDMSLKAIEAILPYQHRNCGGFYVSKYGAESGEGLLELNTTGMGGLACLATGRMKEAVAAGDFLVQLLSKQPNLNKGLYGYMDPKSGSLITSQAASEDDIYSNTGVAPKSALDKYLFYYDNESNEIQPYANLGTALPFLSYLYKATGSKSYLDAAMKLFQFLDYAGEKCWVKGQTTKVLWGLALLYDITGNQQVFSAIRAECDHFCNTQLENGVWIAPIAFDDFSKQPKWVSLCLAGDILLSIKAVLTYLGE